MSRKYEYEQLSKDKIRLLRLKFGEPNDELEGNLLVRQLRVDDGGSEKGSEHPSPPVNPNSQQRIPDAEKYDALSYSWGSEPKANESKPFIKILSGDDSHKITIRSNLESALRQFRTKLSEDTPDLYLWIDALCINQADRDEKSSQIPRMAEIYNQAENVRVWLGKEGDKSDKAMKFITRLLNLHEFDELVKGSGTPEEWAAFSALMRRPWFNRRWIVQEIALARTATLHCGKEVVKWKEFADAVSLFMSRHDDIRKLFRGSPEYNYHPDFLGEVEQLGANRLVDAACNLFRKADDGTIMEHLMSLEALMSTLSVFEASDFHDTVYAILWLANDARPVAGQVNGFALAEEPVDHTPAPSATSSPVVESSYCFPAPQGGLNITTGIVHSPLGLSPSGDDRAHFTFPATPTSDPSRSNHPNNNLLQPPTANQPRRRRSVSDFNLTNAERLFGQKAPDPIEVNYGKNVFEVCRDFLRFTIGRSFSLDIICRPWAPKDPSLPSWVPQISGAPFGLNPKKVYSRVRADPLVGLPGTGKRNYNASGKTKAVWTTGAEKRLGDKGAEKSLFVKGFVLDTVDVIEVPAQAGDIPSSWLELGGWKPEDPSPPDDFWRTLVADRGPGGQLPPPAIYQLACEHAFKQRATGGDLSTREQLIDSDCPSIVKEFLRRVQSVVFSRKLILSRGKKRPKSKKFLGLAPDKAKEGDLICILYGCSVPVLLRKNLKRKNTDESGHNAELQGVGQLTNGNTPYVRLDGGAPVAEIDLDDASQYHFIGECYVHGMMAGEAFRYQKIHNLPTELFELI